jgi:hypothetical protein
MVGGGVEATAAAARYNLYVCVALGVWRTAVVVAQDVVEVVWKICMYMG